VISVAVFIGALIIAPSTPHAEIASLILMDIAIGAGAVFMTFQLETRDRRVFLLQARDSINRAELVDRNHGLLLAVNTDGLTGAANRRCFDEVLSQTWRVARERGEPVGLIMMDIDHFKFFNDHQGHKGGDDCLTMVAGAARSEARMRQGIERMRIKHAGLGDNAIVTASFGAASMVPAPGEGLIVLLEAADSSLYLAKRRGRNRVAAGERGSLENRTDLPMRTD
jgi:PleD family two-component response regulator